MKYLYFVPLLLFDKPVSLVSQILLFSYQKFYEKLLADTESEFEHGKNIHWLFFVSSPKPLPFALINFLAVILLTRAMLGEGEVRGI